MSQGGEKSEQPTAKRIRDARRKGQVARSQDLTTALILLAGAGGAWLAAGSMRAQLASAMGEGLSRAASFRGRLDAALAWQVLSDGVSTAALALLPLLLPLFITGLTAGYLQAGPLCAFEALKPDLHRLNPASSLRQHLFTSRAFLELFKAVSKITAVCLIGAHVVWGARADVIQLARQPPPAALGLTSSLLGEICLKVGFAFLACGAGDYLLQRHLHLKRLKMTKREVREEHKESEGDPLAKSARRQMHREILSQSAAAAVKRADVLVVNPTHLAVALRYERGEMAAPVVVAKGAELMAAHLRRLAAEARRPVLRDVPLARSLYELEVDEEIPEELYEAVAAVLRWAYQLSAAEAGG